MRGFLLIVLAGLGSTVLGGGLGWLVGTLSPEFVELVAYPQPVAEPGRLAAALGMVSGLLLGAAAMAFALLIEAFRAWALRGRAGTEVPPNAVLPPADRATPARTDFTARSA
jgi:hypothetical protein